jgi:hypothetical protein
MNEYNEMTHSISKFNIELNEALKKAHKVYESLKIAMEVTGTNARIKKMKEEILLLGWDKVVEKYHPDVNIHDKAANELFEMYKYVNDNIERC